MGSVQKSLRIPEDTAKEIERLAGESGRDFSAVTKDLLEEAVKMRRCPGILFADGVTGRRARIAGTGIEVREVIATYDSLDRSFERLEKAYHWLTDQQLRAALGYYSLYPKEIDRQNERSESWTREKILRAYPHLAGEDG